MASKMAGPIWGLSKSDVSKRYGFTSGGVSVVLWRKMARTASISRSLATVGGRDGCGEGEELARGESDSNNHEYKRLKETIKMVKC